MGSKIRVHELSKALGVPSKAVIEECQKQGLDVKNHMGVLDDSALDKLSEVYSKEIIAALRSGVRSVEVVDPFDAGKTEKIIRGKLDAEGVNVIISRRPCFLAAKRMKS